MPEVLEDDPAQEALRTQAVIKVRDTIACRWLALRRVAQQWHLHQRKDALSVTREVILNLITIHGAHFEFAPDADILVPMPGFQCEVDQGGNLVEEEVETTSSHKSSRTSSACIEHKFMFAQTQGDVWTCLQASWWRI